MPVFARAKRVTDPLDDRVRDRIVGRGMHEPAYVSSGSEHSAGSGYDSDLLHCFLHNDCEEEENAAGDCNVTADDCEVECDSDSDSDSERTDAVVENVISILRNQYVDRFRNLLVHNVVKGIRVFNSQNPNNQILNRNVMLYLQKNGYNAAICKTKWNTCGGLTGGSYEFIDVVRTDSGDRYFVDVNFAAQFEIARETKHFRRICEHLPVVFVGKSDDLKQIVKLISDAARRSLKSKGLLLPPWRKNRFMQNKWFGPYRRTVNYTPMNVSSVSGVQMKQTSSPVICRSVGFNAVSCSNVPLLPAASTKPLDRLPNHGIAPQLCQRMPSPKTSPIDNVETSPNRYQRNTLDHTSMACLQKTIACSTVLGHHYTSDTSPN
ncbi:uncharacterized protein [Rutidosis leptorrhynchoides]|uniref:uncharacterized protein n=1 Tax=Rutidosis leptorrhynchoides TaxID=125765 RepID=UPI003A9A440E